jgi:hypothetical protein
MKRYLVITYCDGTIDIVYVAYTSEDARAYMIMDVQQFINQLDPDFPYESSIGEDYAFVDSCGDMCDWVIKEIEA